MATTDKHPPLDPRRHSTNKRVKAKTTTSVGTAYKTASGSKRISPGDGSKPAAKTIGPYETASTLAKKEADKKRERERKQGRIYTYPELARSQAPKKSIKT